MPSGYHAYPQQLYGCLVHSKPGSDYKGGFFGYLIGPDNLRPHQFFFELVGAAGEQYVGMNYKRFACDKACWNTTKDIVLLNYTPDIDDLMPAPLKNDFVATVQECLKSASGKCEDKDCPRCRLLRAFEVTCNM